MKHMKVQCWIFTKQNGVPLCLLLKTNESRGMFWQPVTGSVEPEEGYFEAACREPIEETGFRFLTPPQETGYEFEYNSQFGVTREKVFALIVESPNGNLPVPRLDPKEHMAYKWVTPEQALGELKYQTNMDGLKHCYKLVFNQDLNTH